MGVGSLKAWERNTDGLAPPFGAIDNPSDLINVSIKISADTKSKLQALPHGISYHVRQALKKYLEELN